MSHGPCAMCADDASKYYHCSVCGDTFESQVELLDHLDGEEEGDCGYVQLELFSPRSLTRRRTGDGVKSKAWVKPPRSRRS